MEKPGARWQGKASSCFMFSNCRRLFMFTNCGCLLVFNNCCCLLALLYLFCVQQLLLLAHIQQLLLLVGVQQLPSWLHRVCIGPDDKVMMDVVMSHNMLQVNMTQFYLHIFSFAGHCLHTVMGAACE